ncbi:RE2, partial [Symbiodinium sp. CCMP2456]
MSLESPGAPRLRYHEKHLFDPLLGCVRIVRMIHLEGLAPLRFASFGTAAQPSNVVMQDAQGKRIPERGTRVLDLDVQTLEGGKVTIREKFAIAKIEAVIVSLGRLMRQGWCLGSSEGRPHIEQHGNRIPVRLRRNTLTMMAAELDLEKLLWSEEDWPYLAAFVRADEASRKPKPGDTWIQLLTLSTEAYGTTPRLISEIDGDLAGRRDAIVLFHVEELAKSLLTEPGTVFQSIENEGASPYLPEGEDTGGGAGLGEEADEVMHEGEPMANEEHGDDELEGVRLHVETPLRTLKSLCDRPGWAFPTLGEKQKFYDASKNIMRQQELHNITHHPFQPWCEACVVGRSKQSPHRSAEKDQGQEVKEETRATPTIQIDYAYTFTKQKHEVQKGESNQEGGNDGEPEQDQRPEQGQPEDREKAEDDYQNQYGLTLVGAESTTGWTVAIPIAQKGATSLKRVTEHLVRLSMLISPGEPITFQCDPEAPIKQVVNAVESCRSRLGLATHKVWIPRASHASNGLAEKAVNIVRTNALTLKSFLEARIGAAVEGHRHVFSWLMRHASFLFNRYAVCTRGAPPFEIVFGRRFKAKMVPFGELILFHRASKHRGELQWLRGVWLGLNERNGAHILGTPEGVTESRSIRRLPREQQWCAASVLGMQGYPWDYMGKAKRRRALYPGGGAHRVPLLPDNATLEELAKAAGRAAAAEIAANTPVPQQGGDEAASDPSSSPGTSSTTSSPEPMDDGGSQAQPEQSQQNRQQEGGIADTQGGVPKRPTGSCWTGLGDQTKEHVGYDKWSDELCEAMAEEGEMAECWEPTWDADAEQPPDPSPEDLAVIDRRADYEELSRLLEMKVARRPHEGEKFDEYPRLTTKLVRDWRRRPTWVRRSRLVARELKFLSDWSAEMFAPASTLATVHSFISLALSRGLEVAVLDVKDAYLNAGQPHPVVIEVDRGILEEGGTGTIELILEKLLPGPRIGASAWFGFAKDLLAEAKMENYVKEPTLFRHTDPTNATGLILHADDGMVASTREEREKLIKVMGSKVKVQVSEPLVNVGDEVEFLKRKSSTLWSKALVKVVGDKVRRKDPPADASFVEVDNSGELGPSQAKLYRECVGRLLYLSHTRPDIQFATCVLSGRMQSPSTMAWKMLQRVVGYLASTPEFGFMIRGAKDEACYGYGGKGSLREAGTLIVESIRFGIFTLDFFGFKVQLRPRSWKLESSPGELLFLMGAVTPQLEPYGEEEREAAVQKRNIAKALKEMGTSGVNVARIKTLIPLLVLMTQVVNVEGQFLGLGLAWLGPSQWTEARSWHSLWQQQQWDCWRGSCDKEVQVDFNESKAAAATQASIPFRVGPTKEERLFMDEYIERCKHLEQVLGEKCREVEQCSAALREVRGENRVLVQRLEASRGQRSPEEIAVATS